MTPLGRPGKPRFSVSAPLCQQGLVVSSLHGWLARVAGERGGGTLRGLRDNTPSKKGSWKGSRDCFREGSKKGS